MPRRFSVIAQVGLLPPMSQIKLWGSDDDGNLVTTQEHLRVPVLNRDRDPEWHESGWCSTPWQENVRYDGWHESPWMLGAWNESPETLELPTGLYEEGLVDVGLSATDQLGSTTTEPPTAAQAYVNASPFKVVELEIAVAAGVVTLTPTYEESGNG